MENKYFVDVHDTGFLLPGLNELQRVKDAIPDFKVTAYTIPLPKEFFNEQNAKQFSLAKYKKWAAIVNKMDWIEVGIHGFSHTHFEMSCTYDNAIQLIESAEKMFNEVGLKYKKIFAAPYWQISYDALVALRDKGYTVAIDRNHPRPIPEGLKTTTYNWSLEEPIDYRLEKVVGHGHVGSPNKTANEVSRCYVNILRNVPKDAKFGFISEECVETNWTEDKKQVPDEKNLDERI
jgi:peptidoglycan/xylan/chitin deacetylase (PgdA/CDA1 family)